MKAFDSLWTWMNSWKQKKAYGGFILHPIHGVINFAYHKPVPSFTYLPLVKGFINLARKDPSFEKELDQAKEYLFSEVDGFKIFNNSSFEYAPEYGTLIHNTYSIMALTLIAEHKKDKNLLKRCRELIERVIIKYWNGKDYTGVINQDLSVAELISVYNKVSKTNTFHEKYWLRVAQNSLNYNREGGLVRGRHDPDYMSPWYNSKMAESFHELYKNTNDEVWLEQAKSCLKFTFKNFNKGLYHSVQKIRGDWRIIKTPRIIGALALPLKVYYEVYGKIRKKEYTYLMSKQVKTGFFENGEGYGVRDKIGSLPWNAFNFELLSLVQNSTPKIIKFKNYSYSNKYYSVKENKKNLNILLKDSVVFSVDKKTGKSEKGLIPKGLIKSRAGDKNTHVLFTENKRAVNFGFVDEKGNIFYDNASKNSRIVFWKPNYLFKNYSIRNNNYTVNFTKKPIRSAYYALRKVLFNTPLFDIFAGTRR